MQRERKLDKKTKRHKHWLFYHHSSKTLSWHDLYASSAFIVERCLRFDKPFNTNYILFTIVYTYHYYLYTIQSSLLALHSKDTPIEWVAPTLCIIPQYKLTNSASQRPRTAGEESQLFDKMRMVEIPVFLWQYRHTGVTEATCIIVAILWYWRIVTIWGYKWEKV